jgi:hypothetical protein
MKLMRPQVPSIPPEKLAGVLWVKIEESELAQKLA